MNPIQRLFLKAALAQLAKRAAGDPFATADTGIEGQESDAGNRVGEDTDGGAAGGEAPPPVKRLFSWSGQGGSYRPPARLAAPVAVSAMPPKLAALFSRR